MNQCLTMTINEHVSTLKVSMHLLSFTMQEHVFTPTLVVPFTSWLLKEPVVSFTINCRTSIREFTPYTNESGIETFFTDGVEKEYGWDEIIRK